jgi:prepilin-type N-terminal cleavage/methylation domain-containing protein
MKTRAAYTLIEVLVATALLALILAGAAAMALVVVSQQEAGVRITRAINYQEQAARLYRLGLSADEIDAVLPEEPDVSAPSFSSETVAVPGVGNMEKATCTITYSPNPDSGTWSAGAWTGGDASVERTRAVIVYRPSTL